MSPNDYNLTDEEIRILYDEINAYIALMNSIEPVSPEEAAAIEADFLSSELNLNDGDVPLAIFWKDDNET